MCSARRNNNYCGRYLYNEHTQLGESLYHIIRKLVLATKKGKVSSDTSLHYRKDISSYLASSSQLSFLCFVYDDTFYR